MLGRTRAQSDEPAFAAHLYRGERISASKERPTALETCVTHGFYAVDRAAPTEAADANTERACSRISELPVTTNRQDGMMLSRVEISIPAVRPVAYHTTGRSLKDSTQARHSRAIELRRVRTAAHAVALDADVDELDNDHHD